MSQLRMVDEITPEDWIARAKEQWNPIKTFCLFSGGGDSSVVAHRLRDHYEALVFIDTGTAAKGVREHVEFFADWIGKPLIVEGAGSAYRDMVLGGRILSRGENAGKPEPAMGFPGKGQHGKAYTRLKERQIEKVLAKAKEGHPRTASVLFLSGVRRDESARRTNRMPLTEHGSAKFVNPLIEWTNREMRDYRDSNELPQSEASALLHRSGECNCGAFAKADEERAMLEAFEPALFAFIRGLEEECEAKGVRWCRWGGYDLDGNQAAGHSEPGLMCSDCVQQIPMDLEEAA